MLHEQISDKLSCDAKTILTLDANLTNETLFDYMMAARGNRQATNGPPYMDFIDERTACVSKPKSKQTSKANLNKPNVIQEQRDKHLDKCGPFWALTKNNESRKKC